MGAIYYRQMVELGKTHKQAMGVVMSHLASRVYTVLKEERPYRLRDMEGNPVMMEDLVELTATWDHKIWPPLIRSCLTMESALQTLDQHGKQ